MHIQLTCLATLLIAGAAAAVVGTPQAVAEPLQKICVASAAGGICRSTGNEISRALPTVSSHPYGNPAHALRGRS